jgi:hypothetical protein
MMMKDLAHNVLVGTSIVPASQNATVTGSVVDMALLAGGAVPNAAMAVIPVGVETTKDVSNYFTLKVQVGDKADGSDMADATQYGVIREDGVAWDGNTDGVAGNGKASVSYQIGFQVDGHRYARVVGTMTGTSVVVFGGLIVTLSEPHAPNTNPKAA